MVKLTDNNNRMPIARKIPTYTVQQVAKHSTLTDLWVIYKGRVYDVSQFADDHPGGVELLIEHAGTDISEAFEELHGHSEYAKMLLEDYKIGVLEGGERREDDHDINGSLSNALTSSDTNDAEELSFGVVMRKSDCKEKELPLSAAMRERRDDGFLDLTKPLMPQVWNNTWSKNYYLEQIHIPRYTPESPTFFAHPILEMFTKNTWYGVLIVWVPIVYFLFQYAYAKLSGVLSAHYFVDGLVLWTLYEYIFHRFVFHMDNALPEKPIALMLHFLTHGVHHFLPMDRYRLVMPPALMMAFTIPVAFALYKVFAAPITAMLLAGSLTGYIVYDLMHYYSHHGKILPGYLKRMKTYHMDHHYINPNRGFGVSNMIWDVVFNSMLPLR